jgi:hypothetical protein
MKIPLTRGQKAMLGLGGLAAGAAAIYTAWQANLLAQVGFPIKDEEPPLVNGAPTTKGECEAAGFDWYQGKCIRVVRPSLGKETYHNKGPSDRKKWELRIPFFVTMLTYRFKAGGLWNPTKRNQVKVYYKDLEDRRHFLADSPRVDFGTTSSDIGISVGKKCTAFIFEVESTTWDDIDEMWASIM